MNCRAGVQPGFSLIEVMVVLAIVAMLISVALPGFQTMLQSQRLNTSANHLFSAISMTRSEAIARGARVDLIPADGAHWENGWVTLIDQNNNQRLDASEQGIYFHDALPSGMVVTAAFGSGASNYLSFNGIGHSRDKSSNRSMRAGHFMLSLNGKRRKVIISFLGRTRVCNPDLESTC